MLDIFWVGELSSCRKHAYFSRSHAHFCAIVTSKMSALGEKLNRICVCAGVFFMRKIINNSFILRRSIYKRITSLVQNKSGISMHFSKSRINLLGFWHFLFEIFELKLCIRFARLIHAFVSMTSHKCHNCKWIFSCKCSPNHGRLTNMLAHFNCSWNLPENFDLSRARSNQQTSHLIDDIYT